MTEGIDSALAQARKAAGGKDVQISGGADTVRQFIDAALLGELQIHLAPTTRQSVDQSAQRARRYVLGASEIPRQ
ncbi:hypothetical protein ACIPPS_11430 [Streptomyces sp. NPDC090127]|uniref:hypothetical protein n=1 Tax=Streptomyces sp. NPDC090127 TaxID=3365953 RepID=UPI00381F0F16